MGEELASDVAAVDKRSFYEDEALAEVPAVLCKHSLELRQFAFVSRLDMEKIHRALAKPHLK